MGKEVPSGQAWRGRAIAGLAHQEPSGESGASQEVPAGPSKLAVAISVLDSGDLALLKEFSGKTQVIPSVSKTSRIP